MRRLILTLVVLIACTVPAAADPASLLIAGFNALAATSYTSATVLTTIGAASITLGQVVGAGLLAGLGVLGSVLGGGGKSLDPTDAKKTFSTESSSEICAVGRVRLGGLKDYGNTAGYNRYRLILHCRGPVDGVEAYWLGGREVIVDATTGAVSSPPYVRSGGSYCYVLDKPGDGTETAWTQLMAEFPTLWSSAHRARGIAQSLVKYVSPGLSDSKYLKLWGGGVPDLEKVVRAGVIYDPRTGTSGWTDNGMLIAYHIAMRDTKLSLSVFDIDWWKAQADKADELVATKTGTEPRARAWGVWTSDATTRLTVLQDVLNSIGAEQIMVNGKIGFQFIDDVRTSELTLPARHMLDCQDKAGPESVSRPNICVVKYYSPERNYAMAEIDMSDIAWARVDAEITATGKQEYTWEGKFCPSAAQAQRIARQRFAVERATTGKLTMNFVGVAAWGCRVIDLPGPDGDLVQAAIDAPKIDDAGASVEIGYTEWPVLSAWNPAVDEAAAPAVIPDIPVDSALPTPDAPNRIVQIVYPGGAKELRVGLTITSPVTTTGGDSEDVSAVETTYRVYSGGLPGAWVGMTGVGTSGSCYAYGAVDAAGHVVDARTRIFANDEEDASNWSTILQTTVAAGTGTPASPAIAVVDIRIVVTVPTTLDIAYIETTGGGSPGTVACRPGDVISWAFSGTGTATARAFNSGGSGGPTASIGY